MPRADATELAPKKSATTALPCCVNQVREGRARSPDLRQASSSSSSPQVTFLGWSFGGEALGQRSDDPGGVRRALRVRSFVMLGYLPSLHGPVPYPSAGARPRSPIGLIVRNHSVITVAHSTANNVARYSDGDARNQPRLHDLRHTAAQHRLIAWYRSGRDVQHLLPQLATYLGHVDVNSTQCYLALTPELLHEANQRFARYAQPEDGHA